MFGRKTRILAQAAMKLEPASVAPSLVTDAGGPRFSTEIDPGTLYGVQTIDQALLWIQGVRRVTRREAIAIPAVKRARDIIAGGLGQLPLRIYDKQGRPTDLFSPSIITRPEDGVPAVTTWTNVVDDLLFYGRSWLRVTNVGWHGKPATCVRLDPESVSVQPRTVSYRSAAGSGVAQEWPSDPLLIRIDSPNDPLLVTGARAIRALGLLEAAALAAADGTPPVDWFEATDPNADPFDTDDDADEFLDEWLEARRKRRTGLVPAGLKYNRDGWSPEELQLNAAREIAVTEIARLTGIDAEDLSVSTTSRTYFNAQDRRRERTDYTLGSYRRSIEGRLSMDDVSPHGYAAGFDTSDVEAADDKTTAETDEILIRSKVMTVEEVRERRGLGPIPASASGAAETPAPEAAPQPDPQEATA